MSEFFTLLSVGDLSEDRRSFKRLILNENAKTGTEIAVLLGEG